MSKGYIRHKFDPMLFLYFEGDTLKSAILVYVDDFIGVYHPDYDINQVHDLFKWGELKNIQPDVPVTFKGKELCIKKNESGACELKITMQAFTDNLQLGKVSRGRDLTDLLNDDERQEFRSVTGCLQWMANQARLEVSPAVSLCNKGHMTTVGDLKALYEAMSFTKSTRDAGLLFTNIPVNHETMLITYTDASWANASHSSSQLGILVGITTPEVKNQTTRMNIIDWRSTRSARVCRSTLAAEACSADEGADRSAYINMILGEILFNVPAHKVGCRLNFVQATDAKSLYDCIISEMPSTTDKRSMINIRAVQETVLPKDYHWVPTVHMHADGLTKLDLKLREVFRAWLDFPTATLKDQKEQRPVRNLQ